MVSTMFESNTIIHMVRLVLLNDKVEDPKYSLQFQDSYKITKYDGYDHLERYPSMGPQYVINGRDPNFCTCTCKLAYMLSMGMPPLEIS